MKTTVVDQKEVQKRLAAVKKKTANKSCCDCSEKRPTWVALIKPHPDAPLGSNILVGFICFNCAVAHRTLGTHVCSVRRMTLDDCEWEGVYYSISLL